MKKVYIVFEVILFIIVLTGMYIVPRQKNESELHRISILENKVEELYSNQKVSTENVNKSIEDMLQRTFWCEDNVKLVNQFMKLQYEGYQKYYLKYLSK